MSFRRARAGQGSLETTLLLGGAVIVTLAILSLVFSSITLPSQVLNQSIDSYVQHVSLDEGSSPIPPPLLTCGNEDMDAGEECDPPEDACAPPYDSSCVYCGPACEFITLNGGYCGDGIVNGPEECDGTPDCTSNCLTTPTPVCGNGVLESGEECDDGGTVSGDGCSSLCEVEEVPLSYSYGAKFEPPSGKILHGMGQWDEPTSGNPLYVNLLTNTSENPLASPDYYPGSKLIFVGLADDAGRWDPFITKLPMVLSDLHALNIIPHLDIALRGNKPAEIDPLNPLYGIDDEVANSTVWDSRIIAVADAFAANGKPAFIRIGGEFNGPWNGYHPWDYPKAFRKIVQIFKDRGADNVAFIWCYEPAAPDDFLEKNGLGEYKWFPGNDVIDWYGLDVFSTNDFSGSSVNHQHSLSFISAAVAAGKPVQLSETSASFVDITSNPTDGMNDWQAWFVPFFQFIEDHPIIKSFHYINYNWQLSDYVSEGWKNSDITDNAYISQKYLEEMADDKYIGATGITTLNGFGDYP